MFCFFLPNLILRCYTQFFTLCLFSVLKLERLTWGMFHLQTFASTFASSTANLLCPTNWAICHMNMSHEPTTSRFVCQQDICGRHFLLCKLSRTEFTDRITTIHYDYIGFCRFIALVELHLKKALVLVYHMAWLPVKVCLCDYHNILWKTLCSVEHGSSNCLQTQKCNVIKSLITTECKARLIEISLKYLYKWWRDFMTACIISNQWKYFLLLHLLYYFSGLKTFWGS